LGIALANRGHEVHFVTYKQPVRLELLNNNIHFHEVHVPKYPLFQYQPYELALSSKLVDTVKLHGIEVLHVHYAIPHAYAGYMARKMLLEAGIFVPMITTLHGTDITLVGDVIQIFNGIQKELPAKLLMVGEGPEKAAAEKLCGELNLKDKVVFLGNSTEIDRILCFSDLFLLPSESESFGLAALEAMINKVAVVSSNAGGIPEVNKDGVTGYLSDVGDVQSMVQNSIKVLSDEALLAQFKQNAFEWASKFDILNILPLYEEVYERAYKSRYKNTY